MPLHERQQLREAIVTQLTGATSAGARVTKTRLEPTRGAGLPCLSVYTGDEDVDPASRKNANRELKRSVEVSIAAWDLAEPNEEIDDVLDALALEVETAMDADCEFGGKAYSSILTRTEIGVKMDGSSPMGCVQLTYTCEYLTDLRIAAPEDDFDVADIQYSLSGDQAAADQAHDLEEGINQE